MNARQDLEIQPNSGWATTLAKGQVLRLRASSGVSFVCFNAHDLTERFDQARTKVYNMRLWITSGEQLFSKLNNPLMTMIEDQFAELGRHDLQYGFCSGGILAQAAAEGIPTRYAAQKGTPAPDHGCLENLGAALATWGIAPRQIPMPLNLFQHTEIDTTSGAIRPLQLRPPQPVAIALRAEMDLVVGLSACPDLHATAGRAPVHVEVLDAA